MAIRWGEDLGAPAVVAVADIATTTYQPTWNRPVGIGLAALGYILGGYMRIGGAFTKNLGIAAAPWAMESIYLYIKEAAGVSTMAGQRLTMRPAARLGTNMVVSPAVTRQEETVSLITP